ncbi:hypothetical protein [Lachnoclostridium sp.]|uniref:hypothetical protein n=1 Tax=Lachnoclostridium sp. TaxID=2028282 RepID=UPI002897C557|nr:hypothetical protein [Lachnoclostridium sp.]
MYRKRIVCGIVVLIVLIGSIIYLRVSEARGWNKHDDIFTEDNSINLTPTEMPIGDGAMIISPGESHFGDDLLFLDFHLSSNFLT